MKKIYLFILSFILLLFVSCDMANNNTRPINQENTIWVSENQNIYYQVNERGNFGVMQHENYMVFKFGFEGSWVGAVDYKRLKNLDYSYYSEIVLFSSKGKFKRTEFTITITESNIDSVKVGDVITFHRVDELPKWAREMEENEAEE